MQQLIRFFSLAIGITLLVSGQSFLARAQQPRKAEGHKHTTGIPSTFLHITGEVKRELIWNIDSLRQLPTVALDTAILKPEEGGVFRGVLLKNVLAKASIRQLDHKDRSFCIIARATDDYKAIFSWGELFNGTAGDNTFVIFEENGHPINEKGAWILACTSDINSGPRHVYWLSSVEVLRIK